MRAVDESADVQLALRRLAVRLINDPTIEIGLSILGFSVVGWVVVQVTGEDMDRIVLFLIGAYDIGATTVAVLRVLEQVKQALFLLFGR